MWIWKEKQTWTSIKSKAKYHFTSHPGLCSQVKKVIWYIFSKNYFVLLRMRVTHPVPRIVTAKIRHSDSFDMKLPLSPYVKLHASFWKGPVSLESLKGPPSPCQQESCLILSGPGFEKLAQTGGGADSAPPLNFAPLYPS